MARDNSINYATTGHEALLAPLLKKHRLAVLRSFTSGNTSCTVATTPSGDQMFIKIKGYEKNSSNEARFRRAVRSNRMVAAKIPGDIAPKPLEFHAFERNGILWLVALSSYGGEPLSQGMFFEGDHAKVEDRTIALFRRALETIPTAPSASLVYAPEIVSRWINQEFGPNVPSAAAEWNSAHCDFHWANILPEGNQIIDWDMFSLAPRGFDAASIVLFSASDHRLFARLYEALSDFFASDSAKVATLFAAARILRLMRLPAYSQLAIYETDVRRAVAAIMDHNVI